MPTFIYFEIIITICIEQDFKHICFYNLLCKTLINLTSVYDTKVKKKKKRKSVNLDNAIKV